jgi:CO/xanthine dehydrogenase Mo-binding subunit
MRHEGPYTGAEPQATATSSETTAPWSETRVVGEPLPRVDGYERVSGTAVYTLDMTFPRMLHGVVVRCPHAHARVRRVSTARAAAMPGVEAVLTADSPGAKIPWFPGGKGPTSWLFDPTCRYEGEEVAAVAARTRRQAEEAARAVEVEYEELPFVVDQGAALAPGAPAVHEGGNRQREPRPQARGDVAQGFAGADAVVERTFRTACQIHTPMELHVSIADWDGDRLTVWDSSQGVFGQRADLADALGLPLANVRVICHYMGGGFGSKLDLGKYSVIAALLAHQTARPVKVAVPREESFLCVGNRPAHTMTLKAGVKKDGTLTALQLTGVGTVGAYPAGATGGYQVLDLYRCPNVHVEETEVYVNAGQARAMRAPGFPQCSWALEQVLDELAATIGMDPVALRLKNLTTVSQLRGGQPYTSTGLEQCLTKGAEMFGWAESRARKPAPGPVVRGVGVAACMWGYGGEPNATVIVRYFADGSANLCMGASDIGTGTKTVMAMVVAEELGVPLERIQIDHADTGSAPYAPPSGGSQTVLVNAPAVRAAALDVKRQLMELAAAQLKVPVASLEFRDRRFTVRPGADTGGQAPPAPLPVADLRALGQQQVVVGLGRRAPHPAGKVALPFAAQFAEVEVDTRTGEVRILRLLGAHDSGRPMNRLTYENQVFGGMAMGIGFGMTEGRVLDRQTGRMVNANWHDYKLPTALDVPETSTCLPIDPHDTECNSTGAKGLGEPATIPTAAAIANAVFHATGVRVTDVPINPTTMVRLLAERRARR